MCVVMILDDIGVLVRGKKGREKKDCYFKLSVVAHLQERLVLLLVLPGIVQ